MFFKDNKREKARMDLPALFAFRILLISPSEGTA